MPKLDGILETAIHTLDMWRSVLSTKACRACNVDALTPAASDETLERAAIAPGFTGLCA